MIGTDRTSRRPRLALLPGLLCDGTVWQPQIEALQDVAEIFVPDFSPFDSIGAMAAATLAHVPGTFAVAGHSMGGRVALEIMRLAPERVERLALLNTGATARAAGDWERRQPLIDIARREGLEAVVPRWVGPLLAASNPRREDVLRTLQLMAKGSTVEVFEAHNRALFHRPDATPVLPGIRCPTVLITGVADTQSPLQRHREMGAAIRDSEVFGIEDCGHLATLEAPAEVNRILTTWFSR